MYHDDLIDTDFNLTNEDDTLTDEDDTLIGEDGPLIDMDDALYCMDDTLTNTDDILIIEDDTLTDSKDAWTDTDDTLIGTDDALIDTNHANYVLPKTDNGSLDMGFVLSIDGGGIRGYSSLMILQALMEEIEEIERADNPTATSSTCTSAPGSLDTELCAVPQPVGMPIPERRLSHYFDYIGGTGSGSAIATMLTEQKMTVAGVMETYRAMCAPGPPRRLINNKVVFLTGDQMSIWLHDHKITRHKLALKLPSKLPSKLAWLSSIKHKAANRARKADVNNASRTVLEAAHIRLLDGSSAKDGIRLLSIGGAITEPVHRGAEPLRYRLSKQTQRVHEELSFRTSPSEYRNERWFNLRQYSRLDVKDDALGDIGVRGWGSEASDERTRWRIEGATAAYLQRGEVRDEIRDLAVCLVEKRRVRKGREVEKGKVGAWYQ